MCHGQWSPRHFGPMLSSFVKVMVANEALSSPFLVRVQLTPSSLLVLFFCFLFFLHCEFGKGKLSGFLPVVVIFAGNYSSFSTELIHTCPLCIMEVHTRGALEVVPVKDINYPFILGVGAHGHLCDTHIPPFLSLFLSLSRTREHTSPPPLLIKRHISLHSPVQWLCRIRTVPEPLQPHSVPRPPLRHSWLGPKKDPSGPASLKW